MKKSLHCTGVITLILVLWASLSFSGGGAPSGSEQRTVVAVFTAPEHWRQFDDIDVNTRPAFKITSLQAEGIQYIPKSPGTRGKPVRAQCTPNPTASQPLYVGWKNDAWNPQIEISCYFGVSYISREKSLSYEGAYVHAVPDAGGGFSDYPVSMSVQTEMTRIEFTDPFFEKPSIY